MPLSPADIAILARNYTAAWCSRSGEAVASFFTPDGSSIVNGAEPTIGRGKIGEDMSAFFVEFPVLVLRMDGRAVLAIRRYTCRPWKGRTAKPGTS